MSAVKTSRVTILIDLDLRHLGVFWFSTVYSKGPRETCKRTLQCRDKFNYSLSLVLVYLEASFSSA